uniref:Chromo domain-containing protein n=1 Tax=Nicotiana tabacum TaxID=4097 RepID=A0A1S3YKW9_TOBAC
MVTLSTLGLRRSEWRGTPGHSTSRVISYVKARRIVEKGCLAYLAYIYDSSAEVTFIDSVLVVHEFPEHGDPFHVLDISSVQSDKDLTYEEDPVAILARQVWKLSSKSYPSVRVQWRGHPIEAATWESMSDMWGRYPHIFTSP